MLCSRVQNLLSAYCDSELTGTEMLRIRRHLERCPECDEEYHAIQRVKTLLSALPSAAPERQFVPDALADEALAGSSWSRYPCFVWRQSGLAALAAEQWERWEACRERARQVVRLAGAPLGVGTAVAAATIGFALLLQPQHPDALAGRVPVQIVRDDSRFPVLPGGVALASDPGYGLPHGVVPGGHLHPTIVMYAGRPAAGYIYHREQGGPAALLLIPEVRYPEVPAGGFGQPVDGFYLPPASFSGGPSFVSVVDGPGW